MSDMRNAGHISGLGVIGPSGIAGALPTPARHLNRQYPRHQLFLANGPPDGRWLTPRVVNDPAGSLIIQNFRGWARRRPAPV